MSQPQKEPTTPAQNHFVWAVSRIEEEIAKAKAGGQRAAMRESDAGWELHDRRRGGKALRLVRQVAKAVG